MNTRIQEPCLLPNILKSAEEKIRKILASLPVFNADTECQTSVMRHILKQPCNSDCQVNFFSQCALNTDQRAEVTILNVASNFFCFEITGFFK